MAFNPFHAFRKHQKPLIAALAIFCMVLFVVQFSFGRGDPVNQLLALFGSGRGKGILVTTLSGRSVTEGDLSLLRRDRDLASTFLKRVAESGAVQTVLKLAQEQMQNQDKNNPRLPAGLSQVVFLWSMIYRDQLPLGGRRFELAEQDLAKIRQEQSRLSFAKDVEGLRSADELARAMEFEVWFNDPRRPRKEYYFGGTPDAASLLDFILWEQQADRLGIVLTEADLITAINHEGIDQGVIPEPDFSSSYIIASFLASQTSFHGATPEQLQKALTREFRFLMAQRAVLGKEGGARSVRNSEVPQMPAVGTPREFLDFYRDQRTTLKLAMLPVPVQRFVDKVNDSPTEATLKTLYEQYKGNERAPDRDLPGFKKPRSVLIEFVSARPDSAFYQDAARARVLAPAVGSLFGGPFGGPVAATWPAALDPLWKEYDLYEAETRSLISRGLGVGVDLTDRRPAYASIIGEALGGTPGALLSAGTGAIAENAFYNVGLAKVAGSLVSAGVGNMPLAAIGLPFPYLTTVLPPEEVEPSLFTTVLNSQAPKAVAENLKTMKDELFKLKNRPEAAQKYIAEAVKKYGLTLHQMPEPLTTYYLNDASELKPLKDAFTAELMGRNVPFTFSDYLLQTAGAYDPQELPTGRLDLVKEAYLWWRSKDQPAREQSFETVRNEVERAWRLEKARSLARAEAERIEAEVKKNVAENKSAAEVDKILRSHGSAFELDNVARLVPEDTPRPDVGQPYRPYVVPSNLIAYPRSDFLNRLMTLKEPGEALVLRDRPAATFYVAVLLDRFDPIRSPSNPDLRGFLEEYRIADTRESMWQQQFMTDNRRNYKQQVEKQMRIDATGGKVDEEGNIILPESISTGQNVDVDSGD